mmetsp:Transcript_18418/g.51642  ORF Transcript_18418/g.51642 Transcript_18418/m.51642 type:complete len:213 (+) Transcript_18418:1356-1994(+)
MEARHEHAASFVAEERKCRLIQCVSQKGCHVHEHLANLVHIRRVIPRRFNAVPFCMHQILQCCVQARVQAQDKRIHALAGYCLEGVLRVAHVHLVRPCRLDVFGDCASKGFQCLSAEVGGMQDAANHLLFCRGHAHMPVSAHTGVGDGGHSGTIGCARQAVQQSLGILVQHALESFAQLQECLASADELDTAHKGGSDLKEHLVCRGQYLGV